MKPVNVAKFTESSDTTLTGATIGVLPMGYSDVTKK